MYEAEKREIKDEVSELGSSLSTSLQSFSV